MEDEKHCAACKTALAFVGIRDLRTGGAGGLATALLGAFAVQSEELLRVSLWGCASCGRLEFFLPPPT